VPGVTGPRIPARAPAEGRVDGGQWRALIRLLLTQSLRDGSDSNTGVKTRPIRQITMSMGMLGLLFLSNMSRSADLPSYLTLIFVSAFTFVFFAIVPDTRVVRERHAEILGSKPLSARTLLLARLALLMTLGVLIATLFGVVPLLASHWGFGASFGLIAVELLSLMLGAACTTVFWLVGISVAMRYVPPERIRRVSQSLLMLAILGVSFLSMSYRFGFSGRFQVHGALEWFPATWFARASLGGYPQASFERTAVAAVLMFALGVPFVRTLERFLPGYTEVLSSPEKRLRKPLTLRLLEAIAGIPLLGPLLLPKGSLGVAGALLLSGAREDINYTRSLGNQVVALGLFAYSWWAHAPMASNILVYLVILGAIEGVRVARQSPQAPASWIFYAAPVRVSDVRRGIFSVVLCRSVLLPLLLASILAARELRPLLAATIILAYSVEAYAVAAATLAIAPAMPLSYEQSAPSFVQVIGSILGALTIMVTHGAALALLTFAGPLGPALAVLISVAVAALGWVASVIAGARMERLEQAS
jgi:hypothetical protein